MAFTNSLAVYNRYTSAGQIPILKSDFTGFLRDLTNMQEYFATNSTNFRGMHARLLLANTIASSLTNSTLNAVTVTPATNIPIRHLSATMYGSGTSTIGGTAAVSLVYGATTHHLFSPFHRVLLTLTTSGVSSSMPKRLDVGQILFTSNATIANGRPSLVGTFAGTQITTVAYASSNITFTHVFGISGYPLLGEITGISTTNILLLRTSTGVVAPPTLPTMSFQYKFYGVAIEED